MKMMVVISTAIFIMSILLAGGITIRPPAVWRNDAYFKGYYYYSAEVVVIAQTGDLNNASVGTPFIYICAFFCTLYYYPYGCDSFHFGIIKVASNQLDDARVVWCANEDNPVGKNATLDFSKDGNLLLKDSNGTLVWSTNTTKSMSVIEMRLTLQGRLQLFDSRNASVWDSFDYPVSVRGISLNQPLNIGQQLSSSNSHTESSTGQLFSLRLLPTGLKPYLYSNPPPAYYADSFIQSRKASL